MIKLEDRCTNCNGYGIKWNDDFDRGVDTVMDTQGLSFYDAVNQTKRNKHYDGDWWNCEKCNGSGKK